ncbi:hypothetical protein [Fusibacter ferrireducens]|uniref:Uncharacterized protein n=1 Tax=Fusibacter ferrireducens TaxID=2785058 RepID=A0ABR9ZU30_9FIRM|nr:hypothetical protein [Fusibacter ferrireducens]MBF4693466.1 hypothetical protein [Fusibacter ferrireducens]
MEINENPFEYHENVEYVACVGNNGGTDNYDILIGFRKSVEVLINAVKQGASEDTLIYPILYNARHSVELSLKLIIERIFKIYDIKKKAIDPTDKRTFTHDIKILDSVILKYFGVDKRIYELYNKANTFLVDYFFDVDGDAFKYDTDHSGNYHMIKHGISSISIDILEVKFNELMQLLDELIYNLNLMCDEYKVGTFTKSLSREDIKNIAHSLPKREQWVNEVFKDKKNKIRSEYGIGSHELSEVINLIQKHREFCVLINLEILIGDIPINELRDYANLVLKIEKYSIENEQHPFSKELLFKIQEKERLRKRLSEGISDSTITFLMTFREFGRCMECYSEMFDEIHAYFKSLNLNRRDSLNKLSKLSTCKCVLVGMERCGQKTYKNVIESIMNF